jgi:23S rRNA A1618 N6-methylase RlmF
MSNLPVDRSKDYMHQMWGTTKLVTDYGNLSEKKKVIQEIMHDDIEKNKFSLSEKSHEFIRNDNDYDDWDYGTEPIYGRPWS